MARCEICRGTFEIIATCASGLNVCLPCWRYDVDECEDPFTTVDNVVDVKMLGDADGPDGEIHGHISSNDYSQHEATDTDVSDDASSDISSDSDHEPGMMVCEPEVELEPDCPMQEPECEDDIWCLSPSVRSIISVGNSSNSTSDTEPMPSMGGAFGDDDVNMDSDVELVPAMADIFLNGETSEESGCESSSPKRQRIG
jgi:hypothetical protein